MPIPNIDLNRLSQLLKPGGMNPLDMNQPAPNYPNMDMMGGGNQDDQLNQALMSLLQPKDEQYDRFAQMLQMMPQREAFQPTKGRRIASALAGLGTASPLGISHGQVIGFKSDVPKSIEIQRSMLDEPYDRAMFDWGNQAKNTLEAAKMENTRNVNSRIAGSNIKSEQIKERNLRRQIDRDEAIKEKETAKTASDTEKVKISKQRADAYVYKTTHPNHKFIETNGLIYSVDPVTSKTEVLKDSEGEDIKSDRLGDADKANLQLKNAKELESQRQSNRVGLEETKQSNREEMEGTRQLNREKTITTQAKVSGSATAKGETPAAKQTRLFNRALEGVNRNPAWKDYIAIDPVRKIFKIDTPESKSGIFGSSIGAKKGGDPKIAKAILDYVYGDESSPAKTISSTKEAPKAPKGWKYVAKPDGGWTAVEDK